MHLLVCYLNIWSIVWAPWKVDQKYLGSFEMWCWRMMEISWTDNVKHEEVLLGVKDERNIL